MNEFVFVFAVKQKKMVYSVFGRIYGMPICLRFYLTFYKPDQGAVAIATLRLKMRVSFSLVTLLTSLGLVLSFSQGI